MHLIGQNCDVCVPPAYATDVMVFNIEPSAAELYIPFTVEPAPGTYEHAVYVQDLQTAARERVLQARSRIRIVSTEKQTPP